MDFKAIINLGDNGPCSEWVTTNSDQKDGDIERIVLGALNSACGYSISCIANNTFFCPPDDSTKVNFA